MTVSSSAEGGVPAPSRPAGPGPGRDGGGTGLHPDRSRPVPATRAPAGRAAFLLGFVVIWGVVYASGAPTATGIELGPVALAGTVLAAGIVEWRVFGVTPRRIVATLGLGRPTRDGLVAGLVVSAAIAVTLPLYAGLAGVGLAVRPGWPWLLVSLVAYHGAAEEVAWRGYAFAHLRAGATFGRAVLHTMPLLALTHVPIVIGSGLPVGLAAIAVAAATCVPLAHLYEVGGRTVWPPALVHAAIDGFKLTEDPGSKPGVTAAISVAALVLPFLALLWRRPTPGCS